MQVIWDAMSFMWRRGNGWLKWLVQKYLPDIIQNHIHISYYFIPLGIVSHFSCMVTSSNGTFSALLAICAENSSTTGEFPSQRPVTLITYVTKFNTFSKHSKFLNVHFKLLTYHLNQTYNLQCVWLEDGWSRILISKWKLFTVHVFSPFFLVS